MAERRVNRFAEMVLSCSESGHYRGEKFLNDHSLVRIIAGELKVVQASRSFVFNAGDTFLFPRNQLCTLIKQAKHGESYRSVIVQLPTCLLQKYYTTHAHEHKRAREQAITPLNQSPLLDSFFASVIPYFDLQSQLPEKILTVKVQEAIEMLQVINPEIAGILSDFSEIGKIDLADFMEKNYMFNIPIEQFGYLTGRSLTTFKRDFKRVFQNTPQKWLTQKRLDLAHHQLTQNKRKPTEVFLESGFENLSHFSYAFKKQFGYSPATLTQNNALT